MGAAERHARVEDGFTTLLEPDVDKFAADDDGISGHHFADAEVAGLTRDVEILLRVAILGRGLRLGGIPSEPPPSRAGASGRLNSMPVVGCIRSICGGAIRG